MAKKYIDAELLKKGLKELESVIYSDQLVGQSMHPYDCGQLHAINTIKEFINSLQQEQPCDTCTNDKGCVTCKDGELWKGKEQPFEDLKEAAEEKYPVFWKDYPKDGIVRSESSYDTNKKCRDAFIAGAEWQKSQMLKDAVERTVKIDSGGYPYIDITAELYDYEHDVPLAKEGELVKIIIVPQKEDME